MTRRPEDHLTRHLETLGQMKQDRNQAASDIEATRRRLQERFAMESRDTAPPSLRGPRYHRWRRFVLAAAVVLILGMLIAQFNRMLTDSSIVWADVVERFDSVSFFNAAVYIKEDAASDPKQIELWVGRDGKARLRVETQVLFAQDGTIISGFDFRAHRRLTPEQYHPMGEGILTKLCQSRQFNLDTVLQTFGGEQLQDMTPLMNSQAAIAQDMAVFDLESEVSPEWIRIWALRESRLPVRLRMWDPRDGECMDAVISYAKTQPEDFFDEKAYEQLLLHSIHTESKANLAYAFLNDPGGRNYAPLDLFNTSGYHLPIIQRVGISPYGAVWIIANKAQNRKPNGRSFYGFGALTDDLGRAYRRVYASHNVIHDRSIEVFVPTDYPFDGRVPGELTITCRPGREHPDEQIEPVGIVKRSDWETDTVWPAEVYKAREYDAMLSKAWGYCNRKQFDRCDRITDLIKDSDQAPQYTFKLRKLALRKLIKRKQFQEAAPLARQLWPEIMHTYCHPVNRAPDPGAFKDAIVAVAGAERLQEAQDFCREVYEAKPDLSRFHPNARRRIREDIQQQLMEGYGVKMLVQELRLEAGCTVEQINQIFGTDLRLSDELAPYLGYNGRYTLDQQVWEDYLRQLSEHYRQHPLAPGQMELRQQSDSCRSVRSISVFTLPDVNDYRISPYRGPLRDFLKLSHVGRIRFETDVNDLLLEHDLIRRGEVPVEQRRALILDHFGLKMVERTEQVTVWIATYDGRPLKDYRAVVAPVLAAGGERKTGAMIAKASPGFGLDALLRYLSLHQDLPIENETGIADQPLALECPSFEGPDGRDFAQTWFQEQFGIHFKEHAKDMTVWVVQRK